MDTDILQFLIEHNVQLIKSPTLGQMDDIYLLYSLTRNNKINYDDFEETIKEINRLTSNSGIILKEHHLVQNLVEVITHIDTFSLQLLYDRLTGVNSQKDSNLLDNKETTLTDKLMSLIEPDTYNDDQEARLFDNPIDKALYPQLTAILDENPVSFQLSKERAMHSTPKTEYIPTCHDKEHSMILSQLCYIVNNRIVSMQWSKLNKYNQNSDFYQCIQTKVHYVANLKPQTDLSLGDCSYLDTCHKLNSCRYLHYLQYIPEELWSSTTTTTKEYNDKEVSIGTTLYTSGLCCSFANKSTLPPQWIRCDVRKFDFNILGKFSCVVADPAWNIHMNLPYGTCNDIELLELPLDTLQDEGVLFLWVTGRAIELGKESLEKWGYRVVNEVSWIKTNQLGRTIVTGRTGHWLNHSKEHLLVGIKGDPQWINKHVDIDLIVSTTRETSRKPDELYGIIERLVGPHARKLEIFGRDHNIRPGWFTVGNQLSGNCIHEMDVRSKYEQWNACKS